MKGELAQRVKQMESYSERIADLTTTNLDLETFDDCWSDFYASLSLHRRSRENVSSLVHVCVCIHEFVFCMCTNFCNVIVSVSSFTYT